MEELQLAEVRRRDAAHHLHSFSDPKFTESVGTRVFTRGEGSSVWDGEGRRLLDGMAGLWCVNVGYNRRELVMAATNQMTQLPYYSNHFNSTTGPLVDLAECLAQLTPDGIDHFAFANSGSEANDTIVRLVRHYWRIKGRPEKKVFVGRTFGYHGTTLAAASLGGMPQMHSLDGTPLDDFAHIEHPHWYLNGGDLTEDDYGVVVAQLLEKKILELGPDRIAAFIGEPVQGAGGVIVPPATYWPEIQRICKKYDILLVADEVICGFGRTGSWFGSQSFGIKPDLVAMAKGLSSGYLPISAAGISSRVYDAIREGGVIGHGYTYSGHPVACAVALANIEIIKKEELVKRVHEDIGPYFQSQLEELATTHKIIGEKRGIGLMAGLQLMRDGDARERFTSDEKPSIDCRESCYEEGLVARASFDSMILSPPLVITHREVDELVEKLSKALFKTERQYGIS